VSFKYNPQDCAIVVRRDLKWSPANTYAVTVSRWAWKRPGYSRPGWLLCGPSIEAKTITEARVLAARMATTYSLPKLRTMIPPRKEMEIRQRLGGPLFPSWFEQLDWEHKLIEYQLMQLVEGLDV